LEPIKASISNGLRDIQRRNGWHDLNTTSRWRSRSFNTNRFLIYDFL